MEKHSINPDNDFLLQKHPYLYCIPDSETPFFRQLLSEVSSKPPYADLSHIRFWDLPKQKFRTYRPSNTSKEWFYPNHSNDFPNRQSWVLQVPMENLPLRLLHQTYKSVLPNLPLKQRLQQQ